MDRQVIKRKVLVIDDNEIERAILNGLLEQNYDVLEAGSGKEGIEILKNKHRLISAIILDIVMPEMDGYEVMNIIRNNYIFHQIPIIVTTSLEDDDNRAKSIVYGANGFITKPYNQTLLLHSLQNSIRLRETAAIANTVWKDKLTGLLTREAFFTEAARLLHKHKPGYYAVSSFDIENFKAVNAQYGTEKGDEVLRYVARTANDFLLGIGGITCRFSADKFAVMYPAELKDSEEIIKNHKAIMSPDCINRNIRIRVGRYIADDLSISVSTMYDRATLAEESLKDRYSVYITDYTADMQRAFEKEQKIVGDMEGALANSEFQLWLQPQYNHATGAMIGAEVLVRWKKNDNFISPADFIPIFEKNGFIYTLDRYIWEQACMLLRKWIDSGVSLLPISVNISRRDLEHKHFVEVLVGIVEKYKIPYELIRLEVTESAFASSGVVEKVDKLIDLGFTVEIDDFGSGYSSLNTLKDVPASILKLDMKFFENTKNNQRGGNIVESVVRMAKWIGMAVIAEGVEDKEQADYLKTIGCYYIQGYFYAKPMPVSDYETLLSGEQRETKLTRLQTLENLDNSEFWNPKSMETLIFNSYIGGACIFEYCNGKSELLRVNDQYIATFGGMVPPGAMLIDASMVKFVSTPDREKLKGIIEKAMRTHKEASCEVTLSNGKQTEYIRVTVRVIASTNDRILCYGVVSNMTEQRIAEQEAKIASERVQAVMDNSRCGITAVIVRNSSVFEVLFVNNRFYQLLGYTREQFESEIDNLFGCIMPEDRAKTKNEMAKLSEIGQTVNVQLRVIRRDKKVIWLTADISLVRFANIEDPVQLANFTDITDQVVAEQQKSAAEEKQNESARKLEVIMSNINGGVSAMQIDNSGKSRVIFNNDRYYELYGYSREQADAEHLDVMTRIVPEDYPSVMAKLAQLKKTKKPEIIDYRVKKRDGSLAMLRANSSLMHIDGKDDEVITSVLTDITEKRSLEDQLRAIVENINGGVTATIMRDGQPEFVIVNNQFFEILGFDSRKEFEDVCKNDKYACIHPDDKERIIKQYTTTDGGKKQFTMDYRVIRRDGKLCYIRNNISVISLFGIDSPVLLSVANDITEQRTAEIKEQNVSKQLEAIIGNINGGVTATVFHDENNIELIYANDGFYELYGYTKESLAAEVPNMLALILAEDRQETMQTVARISAERGSATYEYRCRKRDGSIMWTRVTNTVVSLDGVGDTVLLAIALDVTAEKENNIQLQYLNDAAHDILAQSDTARAINITLKKLLEYHSADRAYIVEFDNKNMVSNNTYEICAENILSEQPNLQNVPFNGNEAWYKNLKNNELFCLTSLDELADEQQELRQILAAQNISSIIIAPLFRDGELIGFVGVDNSKKPITQAYRLKAISDYIAVLLTRRDLNRDIELKNTALKQMVDDTPGGFCRMVIHKDKNPTLHSMNAGFARMLGMTEKEVFDSYGDDMYKCLAAEDIVNAAKDSENAHFDGGQFSTKCRLKKKNGDYLWVMVYGRFVQDKSGEIYLNSYFTDISEQKKAEELRINMMDNLAYGVALYSYDGNKLSVIHINKRYWQLVERDPVNYSNASVFDAIYPDDRVSVYREIDTAVRQNRNVQVDARILCGNGNYKPFRIVASVLHESDGTYTFIASYTAISDEVMSFQEVLPIVLSTMMAASEDLTYVKDIDGRYITCSHSAAPEIGLTNEKDIIGKTDRELFSKDIADSFLAEDALIYKTAKPLLDRIGSFTCADGNQIVYKTDKYPLLDRAGKVIGIYAISRDVTKQKKTEFELNTLLKFIPSGIFKYSADEKEEFAYINNNFIHALGYTEKQFRTKFNNCFREMVWYEDREEAEKEIKAQEINGKIGKFDYRIEAADGSLRWFHDEGVKITDQEGKSWYYVTIVDITERKEAESNLRLAEEEYRIATRHSGHTIGRYDIAKSILTITEDAETRLALPETITDVPYGRVKLGKISDDTVAAYIEFYENIRKGIKENTVTFKKLLSGDWKWINEKATTIFDDDGKPVSAIISYKDVTEQQEKEAAYKKWQQALDEKDSETYTLFRCNLNKNTDFDSVEGTLIDFRQDESAEDVPFSERSRSFADQCVVKEDRERYISFVNTDALLASYYRGKRSATLEFRGRLTNSKVHWLRLSVELVEYPNSTDVEAYLMYEDINEVKLAELQTKQQAETDPLTGLFNRKTFASLLERVIAEQKKDYYTALFLMDMDGFKQVNDNFGHSVGDQVLIDAGNTMRSVIRGKDIVCRLGGDEFLVCLTDMPSREAIFDKAQQICTLLQRAFSFGIRLSVSLGIAVSPDDGMTFDELYHKADKALYNVKDHGKNSCMFFGEKMNEPKDNTEISERTDNNRILVVDDNKVNRAFLENIFKDEYIVNTVNSGEEALIYLRRYAREVSIVLLDLMMPGIDGFTVLEKMRSDEAFKTIPVIVVSGVDDRETNLRAIRCGAFDFITKPIDGDLLRIRVKSAINRTELERLAIQNHYLTLQHYEMQKYRSVLEDDGTVIIEYNSDNGTYTYDKAVGNFIAGRFDSRPLFTILTEDMVASAEDVEKLKTTVSRLLGNHDRKSAGITVKLMTPDGGSALFRIKVMKCGDEANSNEKLLYAFTNLSIIEAE